MVRGREAPSRTTLCPWGYVWRSHSLFTAAPRAASRILTLCVIKPLRDDGEYLRGEIGHNRIKYRETGLRHPQPAIGVDDNRAFFTQHRDPAGIEGTA